MFGSAGALPKDPAKAYLIISIFRKVSSIFLSLSRENFRFAHFFAGGMEKENPASQLSLYGGMEKGKLCVTSCASWRHGEGQTLRHILRPMAVRRRANPASHLASHGGERTGRRIGIRKKGHRNTQRGTEKDALEYATGYGKRSVPRCGRGDVI